MSADTLESLLRWLNERMAPDNVTIQADTPLFEGIIDSLKVLELIAWTEKETGQIIPDQKIVMSNFSTARRVAEVFGKD